MLPVGSASASRGSFRSQAPLPGSVDLPDLVAGGVPDAHAVLARVRHVHHVVRDADAEREADAIARGPQVRGDPGAAGGELDDAVVPRIGDVDVPRRVDPDVTRVPELVRAGPVGPHPPQLRAGRRILRDLVVARVRDHEGAVGGDLHAGGVHLRVVRPPERAEESGRGARVGAGRRCHQHRASDDRAQGDGEHRSPHRGPPTVFGSIRRSLHLEASRSRATALTSLSSSPVHGWGRPQVTYPEGCMVAHRGPHIIPQSATTRLGRTS